MLTCVYDDSIGFDTKADLELESLASSVLSALRDGETQQPQFPNLHINVNTDTKDKGEDKALPDTAAARKGAFSTPFLLFNSFSSPKKPWIYFSG